MIQTQDLSVGYIRDRPLLKNLNFQFDSKIYGILGESGIGKTTLLRTIAGLEKPLSGKVISSGGPIYMMHQTYTCFDWLTVIDNVLIASKVKHQKITGEIQDRAIKALEDVGLKDYLNYLPAELSGGMRQRLALARTMFVDPAVILMDEPLSALDEDTRRKMQDLILLRHKETKNTILMVTHSSKEAERLCDEIIKIRREEYGIT